MNDVEKGQVKSFAKSIERYLKGENFSVLKHLNTCTFRGRKISAESYLASGADDGRCLIYLEGVPSTGYVDFRFRWGEFNEILDLECKKLLDEWEAFRWV